MKLSPKVRLSATIVRVETLGPASDLRRHYEVLEGGKKEGDGENRAP